ncbi:MAG TPA: WXG100 family type VII secretion target [Micromonosporaceae bacterium]
MGTDGQLNINFVRLQETSSHIQGTVQALQSQLDQLERDAAPLVANWQGPAQQAYQERQATWRQASAELTSMLQAIKHALDESVADFQQTERRNASLFAG